MPDVSRRATIILQARDEASAVLRQAGASVGAHGQQVDQSARLAKTAALNYTAMAQSLTGVTTQQQVGAQVLASLNQKYRAGLLDSQQYRDATEKVGLSTGAMSQASLKATQSINQLTADYAQGRITSEEFSAGIGKTSTELVNSEKATLRAQQATQAFHSALKLAAVGGVVALGAALMDSVKQATEFEKSMSLIRGLTDTSAAQFAGMGDAVRGMSKEFPQSANELAKALYFISSSGFQGAQAMDILKASAMASAAGLGETKTIADAVTSTLNAYKLSGADAARVTDILTTAVKEGKGEPAEFAGSLGRVLPIAAAAGVSMEQVAASMATMTRTGLSADEAATALRGTIGALLAPSKQAVAALAEIGLSVADVSKMIKGDGLQATLALLIERTNGNVEALDAIIPNVRALTGVLSTAGSQGADYAKILQAMMEAGGTTAKAFGVAAETLDFKLKKLNNTFDDIKIGIGNKLIPVLGNAATALDVMINGQDKIQQAFDATEQKIQGSAKTYEEYKSATEATARAAGLIRDEFQAMGGKVTIVSQSFHMLTQEQWDYNAQVAQSMDIAAKSGLNLSAEYAGLAKAQQGAADTAGTLAEQQGVAKAALDAQTEALGELNTAMAGAVAKEFTNYLGKQDELKTKAAELKQQIDELTGAQGQAVTGTKAATLSADELAAAQAKLKAVDEDLLLRARKKNETDAELEARMTALQVQHDKLTTKIGGTTAAVQGYVDNSKKIGELTKEYDAVNAAIADNAAAHEDATKRILFDYLQQEITRQNDLAGIKGYTDQQIAFLNDTAVKMGLKSQADVLAYQAIAQAAQLAATDQAGAQALVNQAFLDALDPVQQYYNALNSLPRDILITIRTELAGQGAEDLVNMGHSEGGAGSKAGNSTQPSSSGAKPGKPKKSGAQAASGANFIVPSGFPNDTYPVNVSSGERVIVIPPGQLGGQTRGVQTSARPAPALNVTMNITAAPGMDVSALAARVSRELGRLADGRARMR